MKISAFLLFLSSTLAADVVILKSGAKVPGKVVDKQDHYEVTSEGVLRTYLKEEVEKILTSPKELLGDADASYDAAKKDYEAALALGSEDEQQTRFKEAIAKIAKAREAYSGALDFFPEDGSLGAKLMLIMQLMRLSRDRLHSEVASGRVGPRPRTIQPTEPSGGLRADDSLAVLLDPAKRSDASRRAAAISALQSQRAANPDSYDLATASILFLKRIDTDLKLEGNALKAVQSYFDKGWLKDPAKLTPATHLEAASWLSTQLPTLRKGDTGAAADTLQMFAAVHITSAPAGPEREKIARALGLSVQNGRIGTSEGLAVLDLLGWMSHGEFDLAVQAYVREYRGSIDTPAVRFVWSYALLRLIQAKKRGFDRPVSAIGAISTTEPAFRDHLAALSKSISQVAVCNVCGGEGRNRCTNCHGQKETRIVCAKCKGKGHTISSLGAKLLCLPCKGTGISAIIKCEKCKDGYFECKQCGGKKKTPPEMDDICEAKPCEACDGRGTVFMRACLPCPSCKGLGLKLTPKADPTKVLK